MEKLLFFLFYLHCAYSAYAQPTPDANGILYVKENGIGIGSSWSNPHGSLEAALDAARSNATIKEIWVAKGTYQPSSGESFDLVRGVSIYGHFAGTETSPGQRNLYSTDTSFLKGNGNRVITNSNNTTNNSPPDRLSGFTITGGKTEFGGGMYSVNSNNPVLTHILFRGNTASNIGDFGSGFGGGMYNENSDLTLTNVTFSGNVVSGSYGTGFGGGIYNESSNAVLTHVVFSRNMADIGGGMYNDNSSPTLTHAVFSGNKANYSCGGMFNRSSSPVLTNVIFRGNSTEINGGGMLNVNSSPVLTNVTFSGNRATNEGGGIYNVSNSNPAIRNSIILGNNNGVVNDNSSTPKITYSLVQDMPDKTNGNINATGITANQVFVAPVDYGKAPAITGDYRLTPTSPALNAGSNAIYLSDAGNSNHEKDIAGNPRIYGGTIDMGAYEWNGFPEINVKGNTVSIPDGNVTPATANNTDFGSQHVTSGSVTKTYTIHNTGTDTLFISGVTISGAEETDFRATFMAPRIVLASDSIPFQVTFDPSAPGVRQAVVTIYSNDADEAAYDFAVVGMGVAPEINVQGNNVSIADGSATPATANDTDFGSQNVLSGSITKTYTIQNTGTDTLFISAITISGPAVADYSTTFLAPELVLASGSITFRVTFDPSATGIRHAVVTIYSNDTDEAEYDFAIVGMGTATETVCVQGVVKQHFSDALFFVNESGRYVQWQWYKNDAPVSNATQPYYSEPAALDATYHVLATDKEGNTITSCPLVLAGSSIPERRMEVSPNPVSTGASIVVTLNYTAHQLYSEGARLAVISMAGSVVEEQTNVQPVMQVQMPYTGGLYVVALFLSKGYKETVNVLVK